MSVLRVNTNVCMERRLPCCAYCDCVDAGTGGVGARLLSYSAIQLSSYPATQLLADAEGRKDEAEDVFGGRGSGKGVEGGEGGV